MTRQRVILIQGSPDWYAFRRNHCNASEAPAAMGMGHFMPKNPVELCEVRNGTRKVYENAAMRAGHVHEIEVRARLEEEFQDIIEPQVWEYVIDGIPLACSIDGLDLSDIVHEMKSPSSSTSEAVLLARKGLVPSYYMIQIQQQLLVTGKEKCCYSVRDPELTEVVATNDLDYPVVNRPVIHKIMVAANAQDQEDIIAAWKMVWPHIKAGTVPDRAVNACEGMEDLALEWLDLKRQADEIDMAMQTVRTSMIDLAMGSEKVETSCGVVVRQSKRAGNVDYKKVPELKGVDLEPYRNKPSVVWTIEARKE